MDAKPETTPQPGGTSALPIVAVIAAVVVPPLGIALGIAALVRVRGAGGSGRAIAIAAIAFGAVLCLLTVVSILIWTSLTISYTT